MCGIAGYINKNSKIVDSGRIKEMADVIAHRGPDDEGFVVDGHIAYAQRRLSIIDLSQNGHQPMMDKSGRFGIVFNGEIYNFLDLRSELQSKYDFKSSTDTEVIIYGFAEWGIEVFAKLNGIFAIAIHDRKKEKLYLARDRFGVKPLYYENSHRRFQFGSEIKSLLDKDTPRNIDYESLHEFLYYGYALKDKTLYRAVRKVLPGQMIEYDLKNHTYDFEFFWKHEYLLPENNEVTEIEATQKIFSLLEAAVKRQLMSDVPVGVFLSGGIDSSAITAFAAKHYSGKINTYSAGFDFNGGHDELPLAKKTAAHYETNHHEIFIKGGDLDELITTLVHHHDEPFSDAANIPLYLMSKQIKNECKVILQGDGGDEIFGGYPRYHIMQKYGFYKTVFSSLNLLSPITRYTAKYPVIKRFYESFSSNSEAVLYGGLLTMETKANDPINVLSPVQQSKIITGHPFVYYEELTERFSMIKSKAQKLLWIDTKIILPDNFLEKVDKSTMANAVEVRVPFLDNELTSYAMRLPADLKLKKGVKKYLLKKALEGTVPNEVLYGPKKGFGVPYANWIKGPLLDFMKSKLFSPKIMELKLLNEPYVNLLIEGHVSNKAQHGFMLWKLLNLCIWIDEYEIEL